MREQALTSVTPLDALSVLLCELGERIILMRDLLDQASLTTKPSTQTVSSALLQALSDLEKQLDASVCAVIVSDDASIPTFVQALNAIRRGTEALDAIHRRLGLVGFRSDSAPVDIFLSKLQDDHQELVRPSVVLSQEFINVHGGRLSDVDWAIRVGESVPIGQFIALPVVDAHNPLAWPELCMSLARLAAQDNKNGDVQSVAAALGGSATYAAYSVSCLLTGDSTRAVWPQVLTLASESGRQGHGFDRALRFVSQLLSVRDDALGLTQNRQEIEYSTGAGPTIEFSNDDGPSTDQVASLLAKLIDGIPINAIGPLVPMNFDAQLSAVSTPEEFYELIAPLGERAASVSTILGTGWLYKIDISYAYFNKLLQETGRFQDVLKAYASHVFERNGLIVQSIDAAHVQGIFNEEKSYEHS